MYSARRREEEEGGRETEEEMEDEVIVDTRKQPLPSPSTSSSSTKYIDFLSESFESQQEVYKPQQQQQSSYPNFDCLVDLSLSNNKESANRIDDERDTTRGSSTKTEREHMFDKVVTPSDVGKLNRLVIPKQHAEKYFPLDTSTNEKGLLLNFEDRNGTQWRFRYSYWNSSQSYVMTKGWSRFVKEKKLDAGDIVLFQREVTADDSGQQRLYIDWKHRPNGPTLNYPSTFTQFELQRYHNNLHWSRLYSPQFQRLNYSTSMQQFQGYNAQYHYLRHQIGTFQSLQHHSPRPMVINSVPIVHGKSVGKRLRLFGVNMDCCPIQGDHNLASSSSVTAAPIPISTMQSHEVPKKVKNSLSLDLDL